MNHTRVGRLAGYTSTAKGLDFVREQQSGVMGTGRKPDPVILVGYEGLGWKLQNSLWTWT